VEYDSFTRAGSCVADWRVVFYIAGKASSVNRALLPSCRRSGVSINMSGT
jgi:hypothetical protein